MNPLHEVRDPPNCSLTASTQSGVICFARIILPGTKSNSMR